MTECLALPPQADDLERCLANLVQGFAHIIEQSPAAPVAISMSFPGPADYPAGIIGDPPNLPAFRGGVAVGPMLEERFGIPVFVNNDGSLFTYGEAVAGFLPYVNDLLAKGGNRRRFKHLFGVTLGTGFGGGIASAGGLHLGDNSMAGQVWLMRNRLHPDTCAEEGACIRAVRRVYREKAGIVLDQAPDPKAIFEIGMGMRPGNRAAAIEAFRQLGVVAGDAIAQASTLLDGLVVIGGGISGSWPLFLPALISEMNGEYTAPSGDRPFRRLVPVAFNLEEPEQRATFVDVELRTILVPGSNRRVDHDPNPRVGVGITRLGTTEAVAVGAYAFALERLDESR